MLIFLLSSVTFMKNKGRVNYIKNKLHQSSRLAFEAQSLLFILLQLEVVFLSLPMLLCHSSVAVQLKTHMTNSILRCMD